MPQAPPGESTPRGPAWWPFVGIIVVTVAAYAGSFDGQFVFDDLPRVRDNPLLGSLDWEHVRAIFASFDGPNYMPLKVLSLAVDRALWGPSPVGYHATNLLLHTGCALLVYRILLRLGVGAMAALGAALLWAVHPVQVESVAWISERKNVLSGLFFFAAFSAYLRYSDSGRSSTYLCLFGLYALALLSKMNTMVLPAVALAYEATVRFRLRRRDLLASVPLFALGAVVAAYNLYDNPIHATGYYAGSFLVTALTSATVVFRYLGHVLWPIDLGPYYRVPLLGSPLDPPVLAALLGLAAMGAGALWLYRRRRPEAFWILWFGITLAPMLNLVPFWTLIQDRYLYLALLGPLALAASGLEALRSSMLRRAAGVAAVGAVLACVGLTLRQVEVWDGPLAHWKASVLRDKYVLEDFRYVVRNHPERVAFLFEALARDPDSATAHNNVGALYWSQGRGEKARAHFERAAELEPRNARVLFNLGRAYAEAGDLGHARPALERAAEIEPYSYAVRLALARVYLAARDPERARRELEACARMKPELSARNLGREWALLQRLERGTSNPLR